MVSTSARDYLPARKSLPALRTAAAGCQGCPLHARATQTVFGDGPAHAPLMLVGEQPGDDEDRRGRAFVGPAGKLLDRALQQAGIERDSAYVTNVVKHFKWVPKGSRRLHQKPNAREVGACLPWLEAEIDLIRPQILVLLGATAAQALLGSNFRVTAQRGRFITTELAPRVLATVHPSSILRATSDADRARDFDAFVADLAQVTQALAELAARDARTVAPRARGTRS
jgi:uracil-DNA glycosylase family protein